MVKNTTHGKSVKSRKTAPPISDITKPEKSKASERLVISSRPLIGQLASAEPVAGHDTVAEVEAPPGVTASKQTIIEPPAGEDVPESEAPESDAGEAEVPSSAADDVPVEESSAPIAMATSKTQPNPPTSHQSEPVAAKSDEPANPPATEPNDQLQQLIDTREYFVPIDAVARKHSIKVSLGLTLLVLLLAAVLIDLMLDTGFILLLQKIPHTHFFAGTG